jgi:predicted O-linked N-acetylglucosamine transferase (SPINDLY family)
MTTQYSERALGLLPHHHMRSGHEAVTQHSQASSSYYCAPQQRLSNAPRQFAYPTQHAVTQRTTTQQDGGLSFAEHLLRRKTPHGTISAGYDATPVDKASPLPAAKHILVSPLPSSGHAPPPHPTFPAESWQQYRPGQNIPLSQHPSILHGNPSISSRPPNVAHAVDLNVEYPPAWQFPGGIDSVLNQNLPFHPSQRYYFQYGSTVPTVLPATTHAYTGPTVSVGTGLYGPYWPDGAYVPYRPAPIRDDRYYPIHSRNGLATTSRDFYQNTQSHDVHQSPHPYTQARTGSNDLHSLNAPGFSKSAHNPYGMSHDTFPGTFHGQQDGQPTFQPHHYHPDPREVASRNSGSFWHSQADAARPPSVFAQDIRQGVSDALFKEKIFRWAHINYVDLLATLQQSAKTNPYSAKDQGSQSSKPKFYPKPPRQPGSEFPTAGHDNMDSHRLQAIRHSEDQYRQQPVVDDPEVRPTTAIYAPNRRPSHQGDFRTGLGLPNDRVQSFSDHYTDKYRTIRRVSGPGAVQTYNTAMSQSSPQTNAAAALELVERLCEESHEDWIEGMLLAGCLAYALGDFCKAMHWYQTILVRDSSHVEAMSNLAATLLALNRREEALNYWFAAVKLRPSYFEAVEHLVGLLSNTQRGKEAVNIIEHIEQALRMKSEGEYLRGTETFSESDSDTRSRTSSIATIESQEKPKFEYEDPGRPTSLDMIRNEGQCIGSASRGYNIPASENHRLLGLIHAKGNMLFGLGNHQGAAAAFEEAIMIATCRRQNGIKGLIREILAGFADSQNRGYDGDQRTISKEPVLLFPNSALKTRFMLFPRSGHLPGLEAVEQGQPLNAAIQTTSNSLLSLAKIYQDHLTNVGTSGGTRASVGPRDILALYYLSLSLLPSPSTANNVGILLATVQQSVPQHLALESSASAKQVLNIPGVVPGSGVHLALEYYNFGLNIDKRHAHLYTNLGSLLKDIGQLNAAIKMYEKAVDCDGSFDIALANLANAVKDQGRIADAIGYYRRAVHANPDFAEAVCGLATALNSVCGWQGRGGVFADQGSRDRFHVDEKGMLLQAEIGFGWLSRVVEIVEKQLKDGEYWGRGTLTSNTIEVLCQELTAVNTFSNGTQNIQKQRSLKQALRSWSGNRWEGSRIVRLVERAIRHIGWQWYQDRYRYGRVYNKSRYKRPDLPAALSSPHAPTVLPFHTFTAPLSAKQIRQISQRNGLRISVSTLRSSWLPPTVYPPPPPPSPHLNVGYVSSDFNNHPLAHLMQSVFGLHSPTRVRAFCYATTSSDGSPHRKQIEREAPVFYDASSWSIEKLVNQIVEDGIHILVNLNGYTRGARNEVFAARPAPIHMSFMGFAGTLGAEWCDYVFADTISVPSTTLSPWRRNVEIEDRLHPDSLVEDAEDWVYSENIIFAKASFFCCDHKQSAPDAKDGPPPLQDRHTRELAWEDEQARRWKLRKERFPGLSDDAVILGNFNQLYKIDPTTFRMYLRILSHIPKAILWLLRFPDIGEQNLLTFARKWAGDSTASRIVFTDVAPKGEHIMRASIVDLFLDTPECNAHTTAADVVWSGTPIVTWGRWEYKMCSRMAGSILASALPLGPEGDRVREDLIVKSEEQYETQAIELARGLIYSAVGPPGRGRGRLMDIRRMLWEGRWTSRLFDTKRWVKDLEKAYWEAWTKWERGDGGDIWL